MANSQNEPDAARRRDLPPRLNGALASMAPGPRTKTGGSNVFDVAETILAVASPSNSGRDADRHHWPVLTDWRIASHRRGLWSAVRKAG
jgi:hypothetical protein